MPRVYVPALLRPLAGGAEVVEATGGTVREVIADLDRRFPGFRGRLCDGDELKPGLTVAVNGHVSPRGLHQRVPSDGEIHFLPAIGGG